MKTIDFYFDFASPNVYFTYKVIPEIAERTSATINIIPCLLGGVFKATGNQAPMMAFGGIKGKIEYEMLEIQRFIKKHGLTAFQMNPHFPVNTLLLIRGLIAVEKTDDAKKYVDIGLKAMWEDGENMSDKDVFVRVFTDAGLDGAGILESTQDPDVKERLAKNTSEAVERGVFGLPAYFVGDEMFFGKERLGQLEALLKS